MGHVSDVPLPATPVDAVFVRRWIRDAADEIAANRDYLTQLDAAIGDADHGINMDRGFAAVVTDLAAVDGLAPGAILVRAGSTLVNRVGGASGPLFGSFFHDAGAELGNAAEPDAEALLRALRAGLGGDPAAGRGRGGRQDDRRRARAGARRVREGAAQRGRC